MIEKPPFPVFPMYFRGLLLLAGMYTVAWSAFYKWFGPVLLNWLSLDSEIDQAVGSNYFGSFGLIVGVVIFVSAFYPVSWIHLILAGIIGKIALAIWFSIGFLPDLGWNKRTVFALFFNEIIWLIPLSLIYSRAIQVKAYLVNEENNQ